MEINEEILREILSRLDQIEREEKVEILFACESGSRAWVSRQGNGSDIFFDSYKYLSIDEILNTSNMMNKLLNEGAFDNYTPQKSTIQKIAYDWWNTKRIPFTEDSGGNLIYV